MQHSIDVLTANLNKLTEELDTHYIKKRRDQRYHDDGKTQGKEDLSYERKRKIPKNSTLN